VLRPTLLLLALALIGCEGARTVTVRVSIPDLESRLTPASGVTVTALPFDRDSVAHAMERARNATRPYTAKLDSLYDAFRQPFLDYFRAGQQHKATSDSVDQGKLPPAALKPAADRLAAAREALAKARGSLSGPIDSLRAAVAQWEDSTYESYDSLAKALMARTGGQPLSDTTDASGTATLSLRPLPGGWWVSASSWDPLDPNRIWYWNVKVAGDTVLLTPESGRRRSR
jgi:hypothetical protein